MNQPRSALPSARPAIAAVALPALASLLAMVLSRLVSAWAPGFWDAAWTAASISALAGMLVARRAAPPADRRRWTLWAAAAGCWLAGQLVWNLYGLIGFPRSPNVADIAWWGFGVVVMASLRSRARSRSLRIAGMFETLAVTGAAIALSLGELWQEASVSVLGLAPRISALVYPALFIAVAVQMLQSMIGGSLRGSRSAVVRLVLGGIAAQAVAFTLWTTQLLQGTYAPGHSLLDPLWAVGLVMIGAGGLVASRRPDSGVRVEEPAGASAILPALMFVALIASLIQCQLRDGPTGAAVTLGGGLLLSGAALIARSRLLEHRLREMLQRERTALAGLEEREAELARLNAQLIEDSRRDPLTGMRNRRALSDDLLQAEARRQENGRPFGLALCDVDHFKAYNDHLGHLAGDQALRSIAATVRATLREGDIAYRFGGEELLLVLQDVDLEQAIRAAERVRQAVERADILDPERGAPLTISVGVAVGEEDATTLLARADGALYNAKRAGRNRTEAARDGVPEEGAGRHLAVGDEQVPRHLRSMLAVSRAAAGAQGPMAVLEALAATIRSELSFHVVAVNLLDEAREQLKCVIVLGDQAARDELLDTASPWSEWEPLLGSEHQRGDAVWLPAGSYDWTPETTTWTPSATPAPGAGGWHPEDMLLLPLRGHDGEVLGVVSVDQPVNGRRPDDGQITFLMSVADHAALALEQSRRNARQSAEAREQSTELRLAAMMLLAETLDLRDPGTARHSRTVGRFARRTAEVLELDAGRVEHIHSAGVLHDLGKLGIADAILYKPGPLDDAEWHEMQRHPEVGARILEHAGLREIARWVRAHHERMDGRGYPDRLAGAEIPLEARILAVADAYEAMIADRPYRAGMAPSDARAELLRCAGTQFDPGVVDAFLEVVDADDELGAEPVLDALPVS